MIVLQTFYISLFIQSYAIKISCVPTGNLRIIRLTMRLLLAPESSLVFSCILVRLPSAPARSIHLSPTVAAESATQILSDAARVRLVHPLGSFVMDGVHITTFVGPNVFLPFVQKILTGRI